jgi:riboflavin kinase/FMN adenylyltransferase
MVVTFEPHAFEYFGGAQVTVPRLTRLREKFFALAACQVDYVLVLPFNQTLANLSARDFVVGLLFDKLHPIQVVVGDDFRFGHQRQGDFHLLQTLGASLGFTVEAMPSVMLAGQRVSSTWARQALAQGDHELVQKLLGRAYTMMGRIRPGDQLGRQLGFPTANIFLHRKLAPIRGVYVVFMHGVAERPWPGVANIGTRPTVDGTRTLLEVHLLDFNQEIYGSYVTVTFCAKLRDEVRYPSLDLLKEQIAKDVVRARQYFIEQGVM